MENEKETNSSSIKCVDFPSLTLSYSELWELYKLLEYQYIPYENEEGHKIVNRISRIVRDYEQELAGLSSRAT